MFKTLIAVIALSANVVKADVSNDVYYDYANLVESDGKTTMNVDCTHIKLDQYTCTVSTSSIFKDKEEGACTVLTTVYTRPFIELKDENRRMLVSVYRPPNGNALPFSLEQNCNETQISSISIDEEGNHVMLFMIDTNKKNDPSLQCREPSTRFFVSKFAGMRADINCKSIKWFNFNQGR